MPVLFRGAAARALRIEPNHASWHYQAGLLLREQKRLPEAAAHFQAVLRLDPSDGGARRLLADVTGRGGGPVGR